MEALGRLAGGIARDFRGIGAGMLNGLQQALAILPADSPARPHLEALTRSMHSSDALTRQILDFSQRQMKSREMENAIDLNALVADLEPSLVRLVAGNSLAVSLCEGPAPVHSDPGHLQQIVTSFIIHAREFGAGIKKIALATTIAGSGPGGTVPATGPFVSLSVRSYPTPGGESDNGSDSEEDFQPWIGMATTQAILAQYGGTMTAAVEPPADGYGRGLRYSLYLPLACGNAAMKTEAEPALPLGDAGTVLLVEQEPLIRELSRDMLERQGFRVLTAGSAAQAERIARGAEPFGVLITAWETDLGWSNALVQLLRDMRPGLRVLFVAGYSDGKRDSITVPEGTVILRKPFSGDSLGREIRRLLDRPAAAAR
jgi:CheY-like chemotaxis protein